MIKVIIGRWSRHKYRIHVTVAFLVSCCFVFSMKCSDGLGDDKNVVIDGSQKQPEDEQSSNVAIIDAVKSLFSLRTDKMKIFFRQRWPYSPTPTLDFRGGSRSEDEGGPTEKVKDAVVKSLDKSKATVEDSAKSAAQLADQAVDKTVKKLKKTLSPTDHQQEL